MAAGAENQVATILVVDDNEANRSLAKNTLEDEGYRVLLAANGAEGISAFELHEPDCILPTSACPAWTHQSAGPCKTRWQFAFRALLRRHTRFLDAMLKGSAPDR